MLAVAVRNVATVTSLECQAGTTGTIPVTNTLLDMTLSVESWAPGSQSSYGSLAGWTSIPVIAMDPLTGGVTGRVFSTIADTAVYDRAQVTTQVRQLLQFTAPTPVPPQDRDRVRIRPEITVTVAGTQVSRTNVATIGPLQVTVTVTGTGGSDVVQFPLSPWLQPCDVPDLTQEAFDPLLLLGM